MGPFVRIRMEMYAILNDYFVLYIKSGKEQANLTL